MSTIPRWFGSPVNARPLDGAVDVDRRGPAGKRGEDGGVEVVAAHGKGELQEPVRGVEGHAGEEPAERPPEEALGPADEKSDGADEEGEVDQEGDDPLPELVHPLSRLEVVEAGEVD